MFFFHWFHPENIIFHSEKFLIWNCLRPEAKKVFYEGRRTLYLACSSRCWQGTGTLTQSPPHPPPEKMFLSENVIFQGFPWVILVNKPLSVTQLNIFSTSFHCGLIDILSLKVELIFSMGILEVVRWLTSKADYNGPKNSVCSICCTVSGMGTVGMIFETPLSGRLQSTL